MMMVTVRRCVACDLLVLALLCCCCCLSVCRATALEVNSTIAPAKPLADVVVFCPGTDGKLRWRFQGEKDWRKCARRPEEARKSMVTAHGYAISLETYTRNPKLPDCAILPVIRILLPSICHLRSTRI
ncbi:surface antigen TASV-A1 (TASV-A1) [Trypanosoma cruzi]|nr:surface antigen TASV-A1 (TASV-A1) [Trypanosoma cruzi]